jgi:hypothetical protein
MGEYDWLKSDTGIYGEKPEDDDTYLQHVEDLSKVAGTPAGARVICWYLAQLGAFDKAWSPKNAQLAQATILRDFGQTILDDLAMGSPEAHDAIQRMMRVRRKTHEAMRTNQQP